MSGMNTLVQVVDTDGSLLDWTGVGGGGSGGTQYDGGSAWQAADKVMGAGFVRKDTPGALSGVADGDYTPALVDANGRLHVIEVNSDAVAASLSVLDDWDESDRVKVNPIVGEAGVAAGAGAVDATTLRVTLASDDPAVAVLDPPVSLFRSLDLDESEEQVKGSAGRVQWVYFANRSNAERFLKFYDDTAANVAVGTTTPIATFPLPGNADDIVAGILSLPPGGLPFSTALCAAVTTGLADNDTGAPGADDVVVMIGYV